MTDSDPPTPSCEAVPIDEVTLYECGPAGEWTRREGEISVASTPPLAFCNVADDPVQACSEVSGFSESSCMRLGRMARAQAARYGGAVSIRRVPVACEPGRTVELMSEWLQGDSLRARQVWVASFDSETAQLVQFRVHDEGESTLNHTCCVHSEGRDGTLGVLYGEYFDVDYNDPNHIRYTSDDLENGTAP